MPLPGDVIITPPSLKVDLSFSKRKDASKKLDITNKTHFPAPTLCGIGYSTSNSRISKKMKSFRHNRKENEVVAPLQQGLAPSKGKSKHNDLMEALALRERCASQNQTHQYRYSLISPSGPGTGHERSRVEMKRMEEPLQNASNRQVGYNEYLGQAFGLTASQQKRLLSDKKGSLVDNGASKARQGWDQDALVDIPIHLSAKDRRPKIQVTIPGKRSQSHTHLAHVTTKEKALCKSQEFPSGISPPSSTSRQRLSVEVAPARLSIVSPLSVVEMPKPRRPFSLLSLEDMSLDMPKSAPAVSRSAVSDTSDETGEIDDRSSDYSVRSSMSSLHSDEGLVKDAEQRGSVAFSVISPAAAGVFDSRPVTANFSQKLRITKSRYSLADKVNTNKPLPPEPGLDEVAPLNVASRPNSRTGSSRAGRKIPAPLNVSGQSNIDFASRRISRVSSLRSKYTPADLDALDDAFRKTSPAAKPESPAYSQHHIPTLSQAQLALEAQLGTISEDIMSDSDFIPLMHDPLQISRGPMHMEPSRKAPSPPSSHVSSEGGCDGGRKRSQKRPTNHVALQMRASMVNNRDSLLGRRISASVVGSSLKAHKVLGKESAATLMEREGSVDSHWSSSDSPKAYSTTSNMSRDDAQTPDSDLSSITDAAFEEVRARLELLSPKNDASATFVASHERTRQSSESSVKLPIQEQSGHQTPAHASHGTNSEPGDEVHEKEAEVTIHLSPVPENQSLQVHAAPVEVNDESNVHPLERSTAGLHIEIVRPRSLGSIAVSEIPDIYASLPSPKPTLYSSMSPEEVERKISAYAAEQEEVERQISADAAEQVLLRILQNLDNLQDLFATATVSRGFYRTFKRHELPLMSNALFGMSPAAWELREMIPPSETPDRLYTATLYLQHYMRDMYTMIALKSMILIHCESFLRADTITALAGGETDRASQIDDAFWRVWTFCQVFGCGTNREDDIGSQMDWLRGGPLAKQQRQDAGVSLCFPPHGFGDGNVGGLTAEDLYDMTEIWTCLGVLVRGFQGKRQEGRDYGIFENADLTAGDVEKEDVVLGQ